MTLTSGSIAGYALDNLAKIDDTSYSATFTVADGGPFDADPAGGSVGAAGAPASLPLTLVGYAPDHSGGDFQF